MAFNINKPDDITLRIFNYAIIFYYYIIYTLNNKTDLVTIAYVPATVKLTFNALIQIKFISQELVKLFQSFQTEFKQFRIHVSVIKFRHRTCVFER